MKLKPLLLALALVAAPVKAAPLDDMARLDRRLWVE